MQVSSSTNQSQALQTQQKYTNEEVYKASNGNVARDKDDKLILTPQGQTNLNNAKNDATTQAQAETQANRDSARESATNFLAASSKKSQVEIYLAVATDGTSSSNNKTADVISELRDVQKQNNAVQAYATYLEAQKAGNPLPA